MPVYEYRCAGCGHEWEETQKAKDPPTQFCPRCGAKLAQRLISKTSFVLKGAGWSGDGYSLTSKGGKS
jgi:putative FmdB family regulatory protein